MNNLNLIIGEEKEETSFYLSEVLKKIPHEEENIINYDLTSASLSDVLDEASMMSLFSSTKVIIATNLDLSKITDDDSVYLNKYVSDINPNSYLIFMADKVDARLKIYKTFKDKFNIIDTTKLNSEEELLIYIQNKVKDNKYKIDKINAEYFLGKVGTNLANIDSELTKLFIYKEEDKEITKEDIDLLIIDNIDNVIYEFTNAILENNQDVITKMYDNFSITNVPIDYLIVSIANTFRQALTIKILSNENKSIYEIAKIIGKKEYYVKKMIERLYSHTEEDLCKYINKLANIDKNTKLGISNTYELALFLTDIHR